MHRTVVVAASQGRPLHDAFALGVALARPRGAEVLAVHVDRSGEQPDDALRELVADAPHDVPARCTTVSAPTVVAGLHKVVAEEHAELLVIGASHVPAVIRITRGDVALDAVRDAPCAVATAPLGYAAKAPVEPRRVGVAWDGSPEAEEALEWAVQLAERTAGEVEIIQVLGEKADEADARALLERMRRGAEDRVPARVDVRHGDAAAALLRGADLDLLVLGSRRHGPVERVMLGSVSSKVLREAECPVVVLPRGVHAAMDTAAV